MRREDCEDGGGKDDDEEGEGGEEELPTVFEKGVTFDVTLTALDEAFPIDVTEESTSFIETDCCSHAPKNISPVCNTSKP